MFDWLTRLREFSKSQLVVAKLSRLATFSKRLATQQTWNSEHFLKIKIKTKQDNTVSHDSLIANSAVVYKIKTNVSSVGRL